MEVEDLRAQTPGCAHRLQLNNAGASLLAQPALDAMTTHLRLEAEIGGYEAAAATQDAIGASYAGIAGLLGGRADEVALFDNATHAWTAAFYSVPLGPGDRILTGRAEYGSNVLAYWQAGTGFLWIRTAALERLDPFVAEIGSATWDGGRGFTWADSTAMLGTGLRDQLDALPAVSVHDLGEVRCAIVTARVEGVPAADVAAALGPRRGQRVDHRGRAQPARHRGPRGTPAGPVLSALLQHRGRTRPRRQRA